MLIAENESVANPTDTQNLEKHVKTEDNVKEAVMSAAGGVKIAPGLL